MVDHYGSQCGYCTPGFVMSLFEGYYRRDCNRPSDMSDQLCGNLCRCTGYRPIRDAALDCLRHRDAVRRRPGSPRPDPFLERLGAPVAPPASLDYAAGAERFVRPASLAGLFAALAEHPQARLVAGATEIGVEVTKKFKSFPLLVSTEGVPELTAIVKTDSAWRIGAARHPDRRRGGRRRGIPVAPKDAQGIRSQADQEPGDAGRQPGYGLADRGQRPGSALARRRARPRLGRRRAHRGAVRFLHGLPQDPARPGRDHPRGRAPAL